MFKYRGIRIRRYHENLTKIYFTFLLFPILSLHLYIYYIFTSNVLEVVPSIVVTAFLILMTIGVCLYVCYKWFNNFYRRAKHKQKLARMIMSHQLYETKDVKVGNKTRKKISYYPRVYYRAKGGYIHISFSLDLNKFQKKMLELGKELETGLYCDLTDFQTEEGFVVYELLYDVRANRININDVIAENGSLKLMKNVFWEYDTLPHMLICGGTGGGKTYFILTLLKGILTSKAGLDDVIICDPKRSDLADLKEIFPLVYYESNYISKAVREFTEGMLERADAMKTMEGYKTGGNYADLDLPPKFLIFDEYVAYLEMLDFKEREKVLSNIKKITMLGRQAGYFIILACQRPDAKYLADGIRDQFGFRVTLGRMYPTGYAMMFGDVDKVFTNKKIKGRGYADYGTGVISEFYSPLVFRGYNFMEELGKLANKTERSGQTDGEKRAPATESPVEQEASEQNLDDCS